MTATRGRALPLGDLIGGGAAAVLGLVVLLQIRGYPGLPDGGPGPALFPGIIGGLLILFGLVLVARAWMRRTAIDAPPTRAVEGAGADQDDDADQDDADQDMGPESPPVGPARRRVLNALAVLAAIVLYIPLSTALGFVITIALLLFGLMLLLGARVWTAVIATVAVTIATTVVFQLLLMVPLPRGPLGF